MSEPQHETPKTQTNFHLPTKAEIEAQLAKLDAERRMLRAMLRAIEKNKSA